MKKIIIYYNFIIVSFFVVFGFLSANSPIQLVLAILFFPLFIYFAARVIPRKSKAIYIPNRDVIIESKEIETKEEEKVEDKEVIKLKKEGVDINRRMFLKLIGSAGLSLFIFSLFTKRAEAAFFGSAPGPGLVALKDSSGNKIDPAEKQPTDGYRIADLDDSSPAYYGFTNKDGAWFIQKEDSDTGAYRYTKGGSSYSTNWTNRAGLTYDYFENIF